MAVQISRVQDRDADCVRLKRGSGTRQRRKSTEQSRATGEFQKIAPRPGSVWVRHYGVASAERLTINESQFQWKTRADAAQGPVACLPAVAAYSAEAAAKAGAAAEI
jgi:hypothetical protein